MIVLEAIFVLFGLLVATVLVIGLIALFKCVPILFTRIDKVVKNEKEGKNG